MEKGLFARGETLIQTCLSHIPSYFLSLFKALASIVSKLEKLQRDFVENQAKGLEIFVSYNINDYIHE